MYTADQSCQDFLDSLASKTPVPGGGGASALSAAVGTALISMVGNYTVGKKKYAVVESDVKGLIAEAEELRARLLELVDADADAFEPLSRAYSIPKDDPSRASVMENALQKAASTPMEILRLCCKAINLHSEMSEKGSVIMLSDIGSGVLICKGALMASLINVTVNTRLMKDRDCAHALDSEAEALARTYSEIADQVYLSVLRRLQ